jgi:hypothetical protein
MDATGRNAGFVVRARESYQGKQGAVPAVFIGARTDPNEQESVVMRPELDERVP